MRFFYTSPGIVTEIFNPPAAKNGERLVLLSLTTGGIEKFNVHSCVCVSQTLNCSAQSLCVNTMKGI